jgi:glutathione S-transferase
VVQPLLNQSPSQEKLDAEHPKWSAHARILDNQLAKTKWIAGENLTIADIAVAAPMHLWREQKLPIDDYKNLRRWVDQVESLDSWKKTQIAVEKALLPGKDSSV